MLSFDCSVNVAVTLKVNRMVTLARLFPYALILPPDLCNSSLALASASASNSFMARKHLLRLCDSFLEKLPIRDITREILSNPILS